MRELKVEDALLYLDQVKVEFGDRPHIYNEFLNIMKTFKTHQIDTPGVIRRVSDLFQGNRKLVLGFNTFLPEGYKIELPKDGDGPPVAVYRAPGSNITTVLKESVESQNLLIPSNPPMPPQQQQQGNRAAAAALSSASTGPSAATMPPNDAKPPKRFGPQPALHPHQHEALAAGQQQHSATGEGQTGLQAMPIQSGNQPRQVASQQLRQRDMMTTVRPQSVEHQRPSSQQSNLLHGQQGGLLAQAAHPPTHQANAQVASGMPPRVQQPPDGKLPARDFATRTRGPNQPLNNQVNARGGGLTGAGGASSVDPSVPQPAQGPLEFDHAINYVTTIKKRFSSEPETYKKFLEILHTYQKEQRGIKEVLDEVSTLFADHPDLLKEFTYFLPDAVQAQAKAQLDQVAKEAEARKRAQAKEAIMSTAEAMQRQVQGVARSQASRTQEPERSTMAVPFGATQGRSLDRETSIIRSATFGCVSFDPVRPPHRDELAPSQAAMKKGRPCSIPELPLRPNTAEAIFFQHAKDHLNRKELAADKPAGSRRHSPYTEFLKCMHLFGCGILNKEELVGLLKTLFVQGHAPKSAAHSGAGSYAYAVTHDANDLLREFEELLIGRGPYANQEKSRRNRSKYGTLRIRDFDFTGSRSPTPSYRTIPSDYPHALFLTHSGQNESDKTVLNDELVCVGIPNGSKRKIQSIEDYDGVKKRRNVYEEMMFKIEDEQFEVDMAIERNAHALKQIEPIAIEVENLREQEEKDGQPIGRLQYRLNKYAMNTIHINAIARLYGEKGDEVLQYLIRNPLNVLPIVYQRLKQKDVEWRKAKSELAAKWKLLMEANHEGSLDVLCFFKRREIERAFVASKFLDECKRARHYHSHPPSYHPAARAFAPKFGTKIMRVEPILYQPFLAVEQSPGIAHKDAFDVLSECISGKTGITAMDRERIGRVWAEFMCPWFDYSPYWVAKEVRESFQGKLAPSTVKFIPGQPVVTIFGNGTVVSLSEQEEAAKYKIKLPFGVAYVPPSAILHAGPSRDTLYIRRDGTMIREPPIQKAASTSATHVRLTASQKILFGTERVYIFLRFYSLLTSILSDTRLHSCPTKDFTSVMLALKKVLRKKLEARDYESLGRRVSKDKVHQIAALPKLVERCADAFIKVAREDVLLNLYDYTRSPDVDPVAARTQCLALEPSAIFRIQIDTTGQSMYFCRLPKNVELFTSPAHRNNIARQDPVERQDNRMGRDKTEGVRQDVDDRDEDTNTRPTKRVKL